MVVAASILGGTTGKDQWYLRLCSWLRRGGCAARRTGTAGLRLRRRPGQPLGKALGCCCSAAAPSSQGRVGKRAAACLLDTLCQGAHESTHALREDPNSLTDSQELFSTVRLRT